jgi:hypothetical protein
VLSVPLLRDADAGVGVLLRKRSFVQINDWLALMPSLGVPWTKRRHKLDVVMLR